MDFEVCIDSVKGAITAGEYGAKRVELCAALNEGGLTPSLGMIQACVKATKSEVFVMIRPSSGGFVYTEEEIRLMEQDIKAVGNVGAAGVVFGVLDENHKINIQHNMFLMEAAIQSNLKTTFHRAIDVSDNPLKAIEHIINIGFDRILTSGAKANAADGIQLIQELNRKAKGQLEIMAGSGVNANNVSNFQAIGLNAIHFTARKRKAEVLALDMGEKYEVDDDKIASIVQKLNS